MKNIIIKSYSPFNQRRYSQPWVAKVDERGKPSFQIKVGAYTGAYGRGEAGDLYIFEPEEGAIYAYGQKDYRGAGDPPTYIRFQNGKFTEINKRDILGLLNQTAGA